MKKKPGKMKAWPLCAAALAAAIPAFGDWSEKASSPNGDVSVEICAVGERLTWGVSRKGREIFSDSDLGLVFKGQKPFGAFKISERKESMFDTTWETTLYKKRRVRDFGREVTLELAEEEGLQRRLDVIVRVYDGAVALRYGIPAQKGFDKFVLAGEKTSFRFHGDPMAWITLYSKHRNSQEEAFLHRSLLSIPPKDALIGFPAIVEAGGQYAAIAEAALTDWAGLFLRRCGEREDVPAGCVQLSAEPTPREDGNGLVVSAAPRLSPWRVVILGDSPAELTDNNDLIMSLNPPPEGGDSAFAWVKPGVSAWDWWTWPRQGGRKMTKDAKIAEIDFASEMGWEYYTIDADWTGCLRRHDAKQDLTKATPELELDAVLAHAKKRNVGVFLWAYWSVLESNGVERVFSDMASRGVKGFKIDFMDRQDQEMVNWYEKVVRIAAKHKLLINFHGAFHPTGMNRTWPNQITREAIAGNECFRFGRRVTPEQMAAFPFTRFLIGPADYTPGSFNNVLPSEHVPVNLMKDPGGLTTQEIGTRAHALALCVAYDSPLMTLCDTPGIYRNQPGLEGLRNLPAAWDDTKCLGGEIGSWYAVARKAPDGRRYFAAITADARHIEQPLSFLGGGSWRMELYADDPVKNRADAKAIRIESRTVEASDTLSLDLAYVGGAVAVFKPAPPRPKNVPELMKTFAGKKVETVAQWEKVRAPELQDEFTREEYGRRPVERPRDLSFSLAEPDAEAMDGKAIRKRVRVSYSGKYGRGEFVFTAFIPKQSKPSPSFLLICNRPAAENIDPTRSTKSGFWPAEEIVGRGYAAIAFWNGDIAQDSARGLLGGVFSVFGGDKRSDRPKDEWGMLSAWAWGASRVMDWIETEPLLDAKRVAVVGHSRGGKTALVAGVCDKRFAMVCANDSGCSGAKLNHVDLPASEKVADVVTSFPYWFCRNYARHANAEKEWRVDQHEFVALMAPRLVCIASASADNWAGQEGEYASGVLASPAWELYGKKGLVSDGFPPAGVPLQNGCISYHVRTGKHDLTPYDWGVYMDFADRHGWSE